MRRLFAVGLVVCLLVAAGCKRGSVVRDDKTFELEPGRPHILYIPAAKKVQVNFSVDNSVAVNAALMSKADGEETERSGEVKGKKLSEQINTASGSLTSTANEKVELAAVFSSKKKATVKVKITGD